MVKNKKIVIKIVFSYDKKDFLYIKKVNCKK